MVELREEEAFAVSGEAPPALAMAMRIVVEAARLLGAARLVEIASAHVDGCLYHGDSGVHFVERLATLGATVMVPTTLNVGSLDLVHPEVVHADARYREMARRQMDAYVALGCRATWTCAPYQAGHRPALGEHVAWAESNAVAFANSVLGARTNRNGDFLDVACAIAGRAPYCGLHLDENRVATVRVDVTGIAPALLDEDAFYPVLGAWLGAASTGAVGLFHVAGVTPEAPTAAAALGGRAPAREVRLTPSMVRAARDALSTAAGETLDCVALGSPHFSIEECRALARLLAGRASRVPIYACTRRDVVEALDRAGERAAMESCGVRFVVDTCVVVAPILAAGGGTMMTSSAKFAHYGPANTGYASVFGSLADCVESAVAGRVAREESLWR